MVQDINGQLNLTITIKFMCAIQEGGFWWSAMNEKQLAQFNAGG